MSLALLVLRRNKRQRREQSLWEKAVETWRYTAFLGSLSGVYVAVDEGLSRLFGKERYTCMLTVPLMAQPVLQHSPSLALQAECLWPQDFIMEGSSCRAGLRTYHPADRVSTV